MKTETTEDIRSPAAAEEKDADPAAAQETGKAVKLARSHGSWKVTEVTSVSAANESMTDPDGKQQNTPAPPRPSPSTGG